MIQQTVLNFKLEKTDETLTAHGGLAFMAEYGDYRPDREFTKFRNGCRGGFQTRPYEKYDSVRADTAPVS
jgi:hypothetical protein